MQEGHRECPSLNLQVCRPWTELLPAASGGRLCPAACHQWRWGWRWRFWLLSFHTSAPAVMLSQRGSRSWALVAVFPQQLLPWRCSCRNAPTAVLPRQGSHSGAAPVSSGWGNRDLFSSRCVCHFAFWLDDCSLQSPHGSATGLPLRYKSKRALALKMQSPPVCRSQRKAQNQRHAACPASSSAVV